MSSEPIQTPEQRKALDEARHSHTAWGKGAPATANVAGDAAHRLIGGHERVPPSAAKQALHEAGRRGLPAPSGPVGGNKPIPAKPPKGR